LGLARRQFSAGGPEARMPKFDGVFNWLWSARLAALRAATVVVVAPALALVLVSRPLTAPLPGTVKMADMTWVEVRSAIEQGYSRVIVPSGGIEQNGPHMILGKHDHIVGWTAERIAAELGRTLVTPVVSFVPEGDYAPPTGHMRFPGTIGVSDAVFAGMLEGIARSLKAAGFKTICFIADHGGSLKPQSEVAARLSAEWSADGVKVISVDDYYFAAGDLQNKLLEKQGETPSTIGQHAGITDTSELMAIHPAGVDLARLDNLPFTLAPKGFDGDPRRASAERGKALLALKVEAAVRQIRSLSPSM
jgi:creatinine amidohydrolase/Fe(II)-dependent formamide hydrolase-like protein